MSFPDCELGWASRIMVEKSVTWPVEDFWRVPEADIADVLHRLELAPWYADHGVATVDPFVEQVGFLEARAQLAAEKKRVRKPIVDAHRAFHAEVYAGRIVRPSHCESCGHEGDVDGHHADYDKPLEVEWLCRRCHSLRHRYQKVAA